MIQGLCGFAGLVRRHGGDVGAAELIDAARAMTVVDLADREAVRTALVFTVAWSTEQPELFGRLFDDWFSGADLEALGDVEPDDDAPSFAVALDADLAEAARIHTGDEVALDPADGDSDEAPDRTDGHSPSSPGTVPSQSSLDGDPRVVVSGELAPLPPGDDSVGGVQRPDAVIELPEAAPAADLELARTMLAGALERRADRPVSDGARRLTAASTPLSLDERERMTHFVRRLERQLDGAPSWRRQRTTSGVVDLRRTMRRAVVAGGVPVELRHVGRRNSAARLVLLVDLSVSVRGTARLVLHLAHRLRTTVGSMRAYGFVDTCVPIDRALRHVDPAVSIERVLSSVDADAASDPGRAFRQWWTRSQHVINPAAHVIILSDGRCNGRDPAFEIIERATARSASTTWISPEPRGAWALGRGEMDEYAQRVDRAISVRSIDDLDEIARVDRSTFRRARPA